MTHDRLPPPSSPPNFLEIYRRAQEIQYGNVSAAQPAARVAAPPVHDTQPPTSRGFFGELKRHPFRYGAASLAAAAIAIISLQPREGIDTAEVPRAQASDISILVGDKQTEEAPTGDPEKISFSTLLGARLDIGALRMATVGGNGHIVFTRSDKTTGDITLPGLTHQQNIEVSAQPLASSDNTPVSPITVTPKDDTYLVRVDRNQVGVLFDYTMPGTYESTTDKAKNIDTVALKPTDPADAFTLSFLPASSTPVGANEPGLTPVEITRVNSLASATEQLAITAAKVMSLKKSIAYIKSATANECFADASEAKPADTTGLIRQKIDAAMTHAVEQWATSNHRTLYVELVGDYAMTNESALQQYSAAAATSDNPAMKDTARDIGTITTNRYANYFGVSATKITCAQDDKLASLEKSISKETTK